MAVLILGLAIPSLALIFSLGRENRQALGPYWHKRKIGDTQRPETSCAVQTCKTAHQENLNKFDLYIFCKPIELLVTNLDFAPLIRKMSKRKLNSDKKTQWPDYVYIFPEVIQV